MSGIQKVPPRPVLTFTAQLALSIITLCVAGIGTAVMVGWQIQGDEMAVLVDYSRSTRLFTVDLNTQIRTQLAGNVDRVKPSWSPDGNRIAFVLSNGPGADSIPELKLERLVGIVNADGSNRRPFLRLPSTIYGLAWSPDGARIALDAEDGIYLVDADGNNLRRLVGGHGITWSPDSRQIIFERNFKLYIMDANGGDAHPIDTGLLTIRPDWSPDGGRIAFYSQIARSYNLYVVDLTSGDTRPLTQGVRGCVFYPDWSPDGEQIAFEFNCGHPRGVYTVDADGSGFRPLVVIAEGTRALRPAWRPNLRSAGG